MTRDHHLVKLLEIFVPQKSADDRNRVFAGFELSWELRDAILRLPFALIELDTVWVL